MKEICICAAIKCNDGYIVRGHRHHDCMAIASLMDKDCDMRDHQQGFVTSANRFIDRWEGYKLQVAANIPSASRDGYRANGRLFSEDLY